MLLMSATLASPLPARSSLKHFANNIENILHTMMELVCEIAVDLWQFFLLCFAVIPRAGMA